MGKGFSSAVMLRRGCKRKHSGPIAEDGLKDLERMVAALRDKKSCIREGIIMGLMCNVVKERKTESTIDSDFSPVAGAAEAAVGAFAALSTVNRWPAEEASLHISMAASSC